ncbi:MAG: hypothetical protein AAFP19_06990 [Bacteroidota bacterium]
MNKAVAETKAERVIVTHGYTSIYTQYLLEKGLEAESADTEFRGESIDPTPEESEKPSTES